MTPVPVEITEDCSQCAALCCLALAFDAGEDFAIDKAAGTPCPNLSGHTCSVHEGLADRGFGGCVRYSCHGAGQRVSRDLFGGRSWRDDPTLTSQMIEAFRCMRMVQDDLILLQAALALNLMAEDREICQKMITGLGPEAMDLETTLAYPEAPLRRDVAGFVATLKRYITP
jgi:hypothetical protein